MSRITRHLATAIPRSARPTPLLPPYSHSTETPDTPRSIQPPYAHALPTPSPTLSAPYRYSLLPSDPSAKSGASVGDGAAVDGRHGWWFDWAQKTIETAEGRERVWRMWVESIIGIERAKSTRNHIPQVSFHSLASHLSDPGTLSTMASTGSLVVRDVVHDSEAESWANDLQALFDNKGNIDRREAVYWHDSLLAARAHPSVLSANNQVLKALSKNAGQDEAYIQVDAAQLGIDRAPVQTTSLEQPWTVDNVNSSIASYPSTPLLSHLALSQPTQTITHLPPTIHSAVYTSLIPLFRPVRSLISFYHSSAYLDPANWDLVDEPVPNTNTLSGSSGSSGGQRYPHLEGLQVAVPPLSPGDMIFRHPSIPLTTTSRTNTNTKARGDDQLTLPTIPLPRTPTNGEWVQHQLRSFERGLPPPHILGAKGDGMVVVEEIGRSETVPSAGGRRAMGY